MKERLSGVSDHYHGLDGEAYSAWQVSSSGGMASETVRRFAPFVNQADTVLDFGCGGGTLLATLRCAERVGVEPNPASRRLCAAKGISAYESISAVPMHSVDVIISNHALEHCLDPLGDLKQLSRVVKVGGRLVFVLPMEEWRREPQYRVGDINHHLFAWTPLTIGNLFMEAGYEVEQVDVIRMAWPIGAQVLWDRLPERLFDLLSRAWSIAFRLPQLRVVARAG